MKNIASYLAPLFGVAVILICDYSMVKIYTEPDLKDEIT